MAAGRRHDVRLIRLPGRAERPPRPASVSRRLS